MNIENKVEFTQILTKEREAKYNNLMEQAMIKGQQIISTDIKNFSFISQIPAQKVNHVLHLVLTIFTFLWWGIIWIVLALMAKKEELYKNTVDEDNNIKTIKIK